MSFEKVKSKVKSKKSKYTFFQSFIERKKLHFLSLLGLKYKGGIEVFKKRLQNGYNSEDFLFSLLKMIFFSKIKFTYISQPLHAQS